MAVALLAAACAPSGVRPPSARDASGERGGGGGAAGGGAALPDGSTSGGTGGASTAGGTGGGGAGGDQPPGGPRQDGGIDPDPPGPGTPSATGYCARWKASLPAGPLPGFASDSQCEDFTGVTAGDVACSGASNPSAQLENVFLAQTHVVAPGTASINRNDQGEPLDPSAVRPEFRLVSHRPALLKVGVTGDGPSPEVRVVATRNGAPLGTLCLRGPELLPARLAPGHRFDDSFTVTLPSAWLRPGLELELRAGSASRRIPAGDLRIAGGLRHMVVEMPVRLFGNPHHLVAPQFTSRMASNLPVQSLVWSRFPVVVEVNPLVLPATATLPVRVPPVQGNDFDEIGEMLQIALLLQRANGQQQENKYWVPMDPRKYGGGLGYVPGESCGGSATRAVMRHELGHNYGLPHYEPWYMEKKYPYLRNHMGQGGGVGPYWAFMQVERLFFGPYDEMDPSLFKRDAMAGGDGADNFHGNFTVQVITDHMQDRVFWDDERRSYMRYDPGTAEFVPEPNRNDGFYFRPAERDVPVYTIWGTYADTVDEANTIQPLLHYRGNYVKVMDPRNEEHLAWLRARPGGLCSAGCDFTLRVTFEGNKVRTYLVNKDARAFQRWAINVRDEGKITKVELFRRDLENTTDATVPGHVSGASAASFLDSARLVVERIF